jgi:cytoskeletal protein CcmA (bactofilin family)
MNDLDSGLDGRLAEGTHINGTLKFQRAVQIDGRFEGNVKSKGKLILGPTAQVDAEIEVGELEVEGKLRGKVTASERLLIRDGGLVEANIVTGRLAIETGAIFRGNCEMPEQEKLPEATAAPKAAPKPERPASPKAEAPGPPKKSPMQP